MIDLGDYLRRIDLIMKPYALVVSPLEIDVISEELPDKFKERIKIVQHPSVEKGKAYLIDRQKFERIDLFPVLGVDNDSIIPYEWEEEES